MAVFASCVLRTLRVNTSKVDVSCEGAADDDMEVHLSASSTSVRHPTLSQNTAFSEHVDGTGS